MSHQNPRDINLNASESGGPWYGVFSALVIDTKDPNGQGRIKVMLPDRASEDGGRYEGWARLATLIGRHNRGAQVTPEANDEVLVAFESGDPNSPIIIGGFWNSSDTPPKTHDGDVLQGCNGFKLTCGDTDGQEQLILETPRGQKLIVKDSPGSVEIVDGIGNSIKLEGGGITITTMAKVTINASVVEVSAGVTRFSGIVQCDTLISNVVVAASYTPGAGNIW